MNKETYRTEMAEAFSRILEEKGLNWKKEWSCSGPGSPYNAITNARYKGTNTFWLSLIAMAKGYNDPRWVTMVQIIDKDSKYHPGESWHLKRGSKATYVEYWFPYDIKAKTALTWEQYQDQLRNGRSQHDFTFSARYTPVFNACDVEGMPQRKQEQRNDITADDLIQKLSEEMEVPVLSDGGDQAYYSPSEDAIHVPSASAFFDTYAYNATVLHELSHSTGHAKRLNRPLTGRFGSAEYAYEELVAEMSSCFMGVQLQYSPSDAHLENHRAYVQSWIQSIREKPEMLQRAIKDAQTAANYMDYKAGLISEKEYQAGRSSVMEITARKQERER